MNWIEISIIAKRAAIGEIAALLDEFSANGITEEKLSDSNLAKLSCYGEHFSSLEEAKRYIKDLLQNVKESIESINCQEITEAMWMEGWQQYIEPLELLPGIIIKPAWQDYERKGNEEIIEIDSTFSFGTGDHETTQCCAKLLGLYQNADRKSFLDIGTGTGILLLLAGKLGMEPLFGIDIDQEAVVQAKVNCEHNSVKATIIHGNLSEDFHEKADIIMANLTVDPLKILLPHISQKLAKDGILIISGIVDERYDEIMPYIKEHWNIKEHMHQKNWHTFALIRR